MSHTASHTSLHTLGDVTYSNVLFDEPVNYGTVMCHSTVLGSACQVMFRTYSIAPASGVNGLHYGYTA